MYINQSDGVKQTSDPIKRCHKTLAIEEEQLPRASQDFSAVFWISWSSLYSLVFRPYFSLNRIRRHSIAWMKKVVFLVHVVPVLYYCLVVVLALWLVNFACSYWTYRLNTSMKAAIILSASVTFLSLPGLDNAARIPGLVAVILATFSIVFSVIALFRYKADMECLSSNVGPWNHFGGEGLTLHSVCLSNFFRLWNIPSNVNNRDVS